MLIVTYQTKNNHNQIWIPIVYKIQEVYVLIPWYVYYFGIPIIMLNIIVIQWYHFIIYIRLINYYLNKMLFYIMNVIISRVRIGHVGCRVDGLINKRLVWMHMPSTTTKWRKRNERRLIRRRNLNKTTEIQKKTTKRIQVINETKTI